MFLDVGTRPHPETRPFRESTSSSPTHKRWPLGRPLRLKEKKKKQTARPDRRNGKWSDDERRWRPVEELPIKEFPDAVKVDVSVKGETLSRRAGPTYLTVSFHFHRIASIHCATRAKISIYCTGKVFLLLIFFGFFFCCRGPVKETKSEAHTKKQDEHEYERKQMDGGRDGVEDCAKTDAASAGRHDPENIPAKPSGQRNKPSCASFNNKQRVGTSKTVSNAFKLRQERRN